MKTQGQNGQATAAVATKAQNGGVEREKQKMTFTKIVFLYMLGGLVGTVWETVFKLCRGRGFVYSSGSLLTPFNFVYGTGALVIVLGLRNLDKWCRDHRRRRGGIHAQLFGRTDSRHAFVELCEPAAQYQRAHHVTVYGVLGFAVRGGHFLGVPSAQPSDGYVAAKNVAHHRRCGGRDHCRRLSVYGDRALAIYGAARRQSRAHRFRQMDRRFSGRRGDGKTFSRHEILKLHTQTKNGFRSFDAEAVFLCERKTVVFPHFVQKNRHYDEIVKKRQGQTVDIGGG